MMQSRDITVFQLRAARAGLGLSISELHHKTNIARATLSNIEQQMPNFPPTCSIKTIFQLRKFFESCGVSFESPNKIAFDVDKNIPDIF